MDSGEEVACGFVVSSGDSAKEFELGEKVFDQVASLVEVFVVISLDLAVGFGRDRRSLARLLPGNQNPLVCVKAFVGEQDVSLKRWQQYVGSVQIAGLPAGEMKADRVAQSIYGGVNLGAQSAFAAPDGLIRAPFFSAPALCWWVRTMVESIIAYSLSAS